MTIKPLLQHVNLEKLLKLLLHYKWQRDCRLEKDEDSVKIHHIPSGYYLRHSAGPGLNQFWDTYGDNYMEPELALVALVKAPPPPKDANTIPLTYGE